MDHHGLRDAPLGRLLVVAGHLVAQRWNRRLADEYGLTQAGLTTLMTLRQHGTLTHRAVADHCFVRPATLTGIIDTLAREGLVTRHRDEADRRAVRLAITPAGRERIASIAGLMHAGAPLTSVDADPGRAAVIRDFLLEVIGSGGEGARTCRQEDAADGSRPDDAGADDAVGTRPGHRGDTGGTARPDGAAGQSGPDGATGQSGPEAGAERC